MSPILRTQREKTRFVSGARHSGFAAVPDKPEDSAHGDWVLDHNYITMWLRPVRPVEAAERWRPSQDRVAFILPFLFEGMTPGGVYIEHDWRLPRIFGLVLKTHPSCSIVKPMDIVMFRPHAFDEYIDSHSETLYALHEASIRTILEFEQNAMKITPQNNYVAVIAKPKETKTAGGVDLPDTAITHGPQEGTIFATSPEVDEVGRYTIDMKVLFSAYSGSDVKINGNEYMLVKASEIVAILEDEPTPVEPLAIAS